MERGGRDKRSAFQPEAMRYYQTSSVALGAHRAWLDGLVLVSTIMFGLLLGYFLLDILPHSGAPGTISAASTGPRFNLANPLALFAPAPEMLAAVPFGQAQEAKGIVAQAVEPRRSKDEGGRAASAGTQFVAATMVIDNQGKTPLSYSLDDLQMRDSKGRVHKAESIRGAGWLSGGTIAPGQHVQGTVAFLVPEGDAQPQLTFTPPAMRVMLRWDVPPTA